MKLFKHLFLILILLGIKATASNLYTSYHSLNESNDFKMKVNGTSVFVTKQIYFGNQEFNNAQFSVKGKTTIEISCSEDIKNFDIRPFHLKISGKVVGNKLTFTTSKPQMLFIVINNYKPLCLFQTPPETSIPKKDNPNVIYFEKGNHKAGIIKPKSGQTIYLEEGAIVKGRIYAENVNNITIKGRGILDANGYTSKKEKICAIEFKKCDNIKIDGIGLRSGEWWQTLFLLCNNVSVSNMNLMSFGLNNDGIDIDGVTNLKVKNCFIGCGDDGFGWHAVDAEKNGEPPTKNCTAQDCIIYNAYAGNGLRVGASMETQLFKNINFKNITVLHHMNAAIRSDHSDWATCKNIRFKNFYIEQAGKAIEIKIEKTIYTNNTGFKDERGHFDGLYFKNITAPAGNIILEGYDENHLIENVYFNNVRLNDKKIISHDDIKTNAFVKNIHFK